MNQLDQKVREMAEKTIGSGCLNSQERQKHRIRSIKREVEKDSRK